MYIYYLKRGRIVFNQYAKKDIKDQNKKLTPMIKTANVRKQTRPKNLI